VRRLTREEARRIAVRAQLLDARRPTDLMSVLERLTFLQLDPTDVVAPSADLVAWSRMGTAYAPDQLRQAHERDRLVFEHSAREVVDQPKVASVRPMADLGLYLAEMSDWPHGYPKYVDWLAANQGFRRRVLDQLRGSGPLYSREIPDSADVPWPSSGWTNNRNVTLMLEFLTSRGEVAVASRQGRQRRWDVSERIYPAGMPVVPADEARAIRDDRRLRALGVVRPRVVGGAGVPVEVEGTAGEWRMDPAASASDFEGRTAVLSPFDRLIHDRVRARELFDFEYHLEMYKPAAARRWGYFALPVLHHDRLVGKVDAAVDRKASVLRVRAVHRDVPFTRAMTAAVRAELAALARWRGVAIEYA
jgi:uncharacterized protein YcaQ